jgi:hypothetical protein
MSLCGSDYAMPTRRMTYSIKIFYLLCITLVAVYCYVKPLYNWDILPYTAVVLKMDGYNAKAAHDSSYQLARKNIPGKNYDQLADSTDIFRNKMLTDADAFNQQLAFYVVKPLYNGMGWVAYKAGVSLPHATVVPSVIAFFAGRVITFSLVKSVPAFAYRLYSGFAIDDFASFT